VTGQVTDPQRKSLSRIDSNSRHLLALINDILDITRIEAGRMPLNLTTFRIPELVDEVMMELEPIIKRSNLMVRPDMPRALPALKSDRQKVKQVVLNLLSNALKFTPSGSVILRAIHDVKARQIVIEVIDTGVGIGPDDQRKVFEDFRQLDSSPARGYGGTGLGLSICRRLAQMLDGTIELESTQGQGSTFMLRLPARMKRR
jgi:two-component system, cell cycle sensor histidine kinase PleC